MKKNEIFIYSDSSEVSFEFYSFYNISGYKIPESEDLSLLFLKNMKTNISPKETYLLQESLGEEEKQNAFLL